MEPQESKKPWQSKTNWVALLVAVAAFIPGAKEWISANPDTFAWAFAAVIAGLRMISKDKISIK